jgi:hypothetical protein
LLLERLRIKRIAVGDQPGQIVHETPSLNNESKIDLRCGSGGKASVLQVRSPKFKPQFHEKKEIIFLFIN